MSKVFTAGIFVVGGLLWFAFALVFGFIALQYLGEGGRGGLTLFSISSGSVMLGMVHLLGLLFASGLCFVIGIGLCAHGVVPPVHKKVEWRLPAALILNPVLSRSASGRPLGLRCVCCEVILESSVRLCPECGWTQPEPEPMEAEIG
jgi:hypothetical protein